VGKTGTATQHSVHSSLPACHECCTLCQVCCNPRGESTLFMQCLSSLCPPVLKTRNPKRKNLFWHKYLNHLPKPSTHELTLVFAPRHDVVSKEAVKLFGFFFLCRDIFCRHTSASSSPYASLNSQPLTYRSLSSLNP